MDEFQTQMIALTRAFGWHRPNTTPCGKPVSIAEAHALLELSVDKPITQNELGKRLNLAKSTISRLVGNMEKRDWVQRQRSPTDGRAIDLTLTQAGAAIEAELAIARQQKMQGIMAEISAESLPQIQQSLQQLLEAIRAANTK